MTREQTLDILTVLQAAYPNFYRGMTKQQADAVIDLWATMFADEPLEVVAMAVKAHICNDRKGFPPHIGAIKEAIIKLRTPDEMTEMEAWDIVRKSLRIHSWDAKREFENLPEVLQRLVGSSSQLTEWAMVDTTTLNSVVASNFMRSYKARAAHEREMLALPADVKAVMQRLAGKMDMKRLEGRGE